MSSSEATLAAVDGLFELNVLSEKTIISEVEDDEQQKNEEEEGMITEEQQPTYQLNQSSIIAVS